MVETSKIAWKRLSIEAVAIVASILLAFAIDAWWKDRVEVELEQRLLSALLVEFDQNAELLREARTFYEQRYMEALRILNYLEDGVTDLDQAEIGEDLRGLLISHSMHLESGSHDGLLASGELSLIRDEDLRNRLAAWPSYVKEWSEEQEMVFSYVRRELYPALANSVRVRTIARDFAAFPDGESPPLAPRGAKEEIATINVDNIVAFDNLVYGRAQGLWYAMRDGETLLARTTAITELIRQYLDN